MTRLGMGTGQGTKAVRPECVIILELRSVGQEPGSAVSSSLSHLLSWIVLGLKRATNKDLSLWSARTKDMAFIGGFFSFSDTIGGGVGDSMILRYKLRRLSYDTFFGILLQDKFFSFKILNFNWKSD